MMTYYSVHLKLWPDPGKRKWNKHNKFCKIWNDWVWGLRASREQGNNEINFFEFYIRDESVLFKATKVVCGRATNIFMSPVLSTLSQVNMGHSLQVNSLVVVIRLIASEGSQRIASPNILIFSMMNAFLGLREKFINLGCRMYNIGSG